jgi:hypothetical protein
MICRRQLLLLNERDGKSAETIKKKYLAAHVDIGEDGKLIRAAIHFRFSNLC